EPIYRHLLHYHRSTRRLTASAKNTVYAHTTRHTHIRYLSLSCIRPVCTRHDNDLLTIRNRYIYNPNMYL
ncbi:hypothetical protein L2E82_36829, partial [Cichorium intybus]